MDTINHDKDLFITNSFAFVTKKFETQDYGLIVILNIGELNTSRRIHLGYIYENEILKNIQIEESPGPIMNIDILRLFLENAHFKHLSFMHPLLSSKMDDLYEMLEEEFVINSVFPIEQFKKLDLDFECFTIKSIYEDAVQEEYQLGKKKI